MLYIKDVVLRVENKSRISDNVILINLLLTEFPFVVAMLASLKHLGASDARRLGARSFASVVQSKALPSTPVIIRPSIREIQNEQLEARNLEIAVRQVHQDGLVVVEDVVPHQHLDQLNAKMVEDARALQARGDKGPFNYNQGNLQQDAPPVARYFYPSIFTSM